MPQFCPKLMGLICASAVRRGIRIKVTCQKKISGVFRYVNYTVDFPFKLMGCVMKSDFPCAIPLCEPNLTLLLQGEDFTKQLHISQLPETLFAMTNYILGFTAATPKCLSGVGL